MSALGATFYTRARAHPAIAGPENRQCPAVSIQSLKNIGSQGAHALFHPLLGWRQSRITRKVFQQASELAEYPVQSVPWFKQPLSVAPNTPPKNQWLHSLPAFALFGLRASGGSLRCPLPAEDTALQECNRSAAWSES